MRKNTIELFAQAAEKGRLREMQVGLGQASTAKNPTALAAAPLRGRDKGCCIRVHPKIPAIRHKNLSSLSTLTFFMCYSQ